MTIVVVVGIGGCTKTTTADKSTTTTSVPTPSDIGGSVVTQPASADPPATKDVTVTTCRQDEHYPTQVDVAGSIANHSSATSDYSFVVVSFNGSSPSGQTGVTQPDVAAGLVVSWSSSFVIPGSTGGSFTCRLRNVYRTPSPP